MPSGAPSCFAQAGATRGFTHKLFRRANYYYTGNLDDIRVYSRALSGVEITELYNEISGPATITILNPNGGEELIAGQTETITWETSQGITNVSIEYSDANGLSWTEIDPNTPNDGSYDWTLPQITSNQCLVRVSDKDDPNTYDTSDDVFTIYVCQIDSWADRNNDCKVGLPDFALFALEWLRCGNPFEGCTIGDGLVSYWDFNEGSDTTAYDGAGNNDGSIIGGPSWVDGISGKALYFDGIDDYVDIQDSAELNPEGAITLAAWYKPVSFDGDNIPIIDKGYTSHTDPHYTIPSWCNRQ